MRPVSLHEPPYLIAPPNPAKLWALCTTLASTPAIPHILILDFTESFRPPIVARELIPGTPDPYASPELLLSNFLPHSEITPSIDIWAFGCTAFKLFGDGDLFITLMGMRIGLLADVIFTRYGIERFPERYWKVYWEKLWPRGWFTADGGLVENRKKKMWNWDKKIRMIRGDGGLEEEDEAVLRMIMQAALRFEPGERATAEQIVAMIPASWESIGV